MDTKQKVDQAFHVDIFTSYFFQQTGKLKKKHIAPQKHFCSSNMTFSFE